VTATVEPRAGGRLGSLVIAGRERLITEANPDALLPAVTWGSFAMLPWVGRMRDGRLDWDGTHRTLRRDFGAHAIHGATYDARWDVVTADDHAVELVHRLGVLTRWPFRGEARQWVTLTPDALDLAIEIRADTPMPVGAGWHPWFRRYQGEPITVTLAAPAVLETTPDMIPTGSVIPLTATTDLRQPRDIGRRRLDHAYVRVDGSPTIAWADLVLSIVAAPLRSVVVHSTATAVCVEPQSQWPDAIRLAGTGLDTGVTTLATGETFRMTSRWTWQDPAAAEPPGAPPA
jgi:galactose mutarotase-like enzyme